MARGSNRLVAPLGCLGHVVRKYNGNIPIGRLGDGYALRSEHSPFGVCPFCHEKGLSPELCSREQSIKIETQVWFGKGKEVRRQHYDEPEGATIIK